MTNACGKLLIRIEQLFALHSVNGCCLCETIPLCELGKSPLCGPLRRYLSELLTRRDLCPNLLHRCIAGPREARPGASGEGRLHSEWARDMSGHAPRMEMQPLIIIVTFALISSICQRRPRTGSKIFCLNLDLKKRDLAVVLV